MDRSGVLGEVLEKGQNIVQKTPKTAATAATNTVKTAVNQVIGNSDNGKQQAEEADSKAKTKAMIKDIYAPSDPNALAKPAEQIEAEDKAKLESLRQKLHKEVYYDPLIERTKKTEEEERPAEKVEREKMEDLQQTQKKKEKQRPIAVQKAQNVVEANRGVSG